MLRLREGSRTPWGSAEEVRTLAEGIVMVSTPRHGGIRLDAKRNAQVHPALRRASGWYEEDCEANVVAATFPEAFAEMAVRKGLTPAEFAEESWGRVREWFPDQYEAATGVTVREGESHIRDQQIFAARHRCDWVGVSAIRDGDWVRVTATLGGVRDFSQSRQFWVDPTEYQARGPHGFVIDPARHARVDPGRQDEDPSATP